MWFQIVSSHTCMWNGGEMWLLEPIVLCRLLSASTTYDCWLSFKCTLVNRSLGDNSKGEFWLRWGANSTSVLHAVLCYDYCIIWFLVVWSQHTCVQYRSYTLELIVLCNVVLISCYLGVLWVYCVGLVHSPLSQILSLQLWSKDDQAVHNIKLQAGKWVLTAGATCAPIYGHNNRLTCTSSPELPWHQLATFWKAWMLPWQPP